MLEKSDRPGMEKNAINIMVTLVSRCYALKGRETSIVHSAS